jgi:hypothetical protein
MTNAAQCTARRSNGTALVEVLGEGIRAKTPVPEAGATVGEVLRAAGVEVRQGGWELFVDGVRREADYPLPAGVDTKVTYAPRVRGA